MIPRSLHAMAPLNLPSVTLLHEQKLAAILPPVSAFGGLSPCFDPVKHTGNDAGKQALFDVFRLFITQLQCPCEIQRLV